MFLALFFGILAIDQITKFLIRLYMPLDSSYTLIKGVLYFTHLGNTGVSFGMFKGLNLVFLIISAVVLVFFSYVYIHKRKFPLQMAMICAGIAGNLIDRIFLGYVVDFIHLSFWPVFNVADSSVSFGIIWLVYLMWRNNEDLF